MTVSVRPASVFKRGSDARREGTVNLAAVLSAAGTSEVHCCADLPVSQPLPAGSGADRPHAGRTPGNAGETPGWPLSCRHRRPTAPPTPYPPPPPPPAAPPL